MVRFEDLLTTSQKKQIRKHVRKKIVQLPNVQVNSWEAFFIIIFLVLVADEIIRPAEIGFFKKLIDATFNQNWASSKYLKGRIPSEKKRVEISSKLKQIYKDLKDLETKNSSEESIKKVIETLSKKITEKELQKITLLCASRLAICDLEIASHERKLILYLAEFWDLEDILSDIKFNKYDGNNLIEDTDHFLFEILLSHDKVVDLIDKSGLRHRDYEEIVYLIHQNGLIIPGDELISEQFEKYKISTENQHKKSITDLSDKHNKSIKQRKKKHQDQLKNLKTKFKHKRKKYGPVFISQVFLSN